MATIIPLTTFIPDGDFTFPQEVEGSPLITTDEITKAKIVTRTYAVYNSSYVPLTQNTPDVIYSNCYLTLEQPSSIQGPILFFQRVFAQLPTTWVASRTISWTRPGKSKAQTSDTTGFFIGWNQYGEAAPYTSNVVAEVTTSYGLNPTPSVPDLTEILFGTNPVDFVGFVFVLVGNKTTVVSGVSVTEPNWSLVGSTSPGSIPGVWIVEVNVSRWRGGIWQTEVVRVFP